MSKRTTRRPRIHITRKHAEPSAEALVRQVRAVEEILADPPPTAPDMTWRGYRNWSDPLVHEAFGAVARAPAPPIPSDLVGQYTSHDMEQCHAEAWFAILSIRVPLKVPGEPEAIIRYIAGARRRETLRRFWRLARADKPRGPRAKKERHVAGVWAETALAVQGRGWRGEHPQDSTLDVEWLVARAKMTARRQATLDALMAGRWDETTDSQRQDLYQALRRGARRARKKSAGI
jgi:hypothetical protein